MKKLIVLIALIMSALNSYSQTYEIGVIAGGANAIGDVGRQNFISPNDLAIGGILKWNRSTRHSFRATVMIYNLKGNDLESEDPSRFQRGLQYENSVLEASLGIEYTFWDWNLYEGKFAHTPYLYTGLTYFKYNALALENGEIGKYGDAYSFAIPMVLGYKLTLSRHLIFALELGARYTFTDDLDGSNPVNDKDRFEGLKFGNVNSNDWYMFTGVTLTYTFGREPCYCNF